MNLTGLLLGAGSSYDVGMPLASELTDELTRWLTPAQLRSLNDVWRRKGGGYSNSVIDDVASVLEVSSMTYEHIVGYLEVQAKRHNPQEYHGLASFLYEIVYLLLLERHTLNVGLIEQTLGYLDGITFLARDNTPLWIFSLNQDLIIEGFAACAGIPMKAGYSDETIRLPRRDVNGTVIGDVIAQVIRREGLTEQALSYFPPGEYGINLLKLHGSLDVFTFNDGQDMLKLVPSDESWQALISTIKTMNNEVRYIDSRWPDGIVKAGNQIVYADAAGEMQFLRRSLLSGVFKYQTKYQPMPLELLNHFESYLLYISTLIVIGYSFGDYHINRVLREWLEFSVDRYLTVVDPCIEAIPSMFRHLSPQITIVTLDTTDYLDQVGGIERSSLDQNIRRLARWKRVNSDEVDLIIREYQHDMIERLARRLGEWLVTLPLRDREIDLEALGLTMEEFIEIGLARVPVPSLEEALDEILNQAIGADA